MKKYPLIHTDHIILGPGTWYLVPAVVNGVMVMIRSPCELVIDYWNDDACSSKKQLAAQLASSSDRDRLFFGSRYFRTSLMIIDKNKKYKKWKTQRKIYI